MHAGMFDAINPAVPSKRGSTPYDDHLTPRAAADRQDASFRPRFPSRASGHATSAAAGK